MSLYIWHFTEAIRKAVQSLVNRRFKDLKSSAPKEVVDDYIASYSDEEKKQK
jgi:hypothetical protein